MYSEVFFDLGPDVISGVIGTALRGTVKHTTPHTDLYTGTIIMYCLRLFVESF